MKVSMKERKPLFLVLKELIRIFSNMIMGGSKFGIHVEAK